MSMQSSIRAISKMAFIALLIGAGSNVAHASAVIINPAGTVALGINDAGHLNVASGNPTHDGTGNVGVSFISGGVFQDATAPGCLCEGWGVSGSGASGYANVSSDGGVNNLTVDSFTSTASTATSAVHITSLPTLTVTQAYAPATEAGASNVLFKDTVTITNTSLAAVTNLRYVRVMDWDIPPTEFSEFVTIKGTATTTDLLVSDDGGFRSANPLIYSAGQVASKSDFTDSGPADHGAYFLFQFGDLAAGATKSFDIYYGGGTSESQVLGALGAVGIELYSLGQSNTAGGPTLGTPYTFAFGFKGVGGEVVLPPPPPIGAVPEPSTYGLIGAAVLGAVVYLRRRQNA